MALVKSRIKRLIQYKLCLLRFKELGFKTVFSYNLGEAAGVTAVQVRKDFSIYGIKGNKRGGYNIDSLLHEIQKLFGGDEKNIIVIGMGNIGQALAQYNPRLLKKNLRIIACFDIDPVKQKKSYNLPVYGMEKLKEIIEKFNVTTAVLTVPMQSAQEVCNQLVDAGIMGILNFAPVILKVSDSIIIENINLSHKLEGIIYNLKEKEPIEN